MINRNPEIVSYTVHGDRCMGFSAGGFDVRSCPRSGEYDRIARSNPLLSPPIGIRW